MDLSLFFSSIATMLTPEYILPCFACTLLGIVMGALPGLGGGLAISIMLPLTFKMELTKVLALMMSVWVGSCSGGFIGSILLGIPGTPASMSTTYDGYALTRKGESNRALSVGIVANFMGTLPSLIIAMLVCIPVARLAIKMGPWEYFSLSFMAVTLVIGLSKGRLFKGFIAAGLGFLVRSIGPDPLVAAYRLSFGSVYLKSGFKQLCLIIGLFAGSMILLDYAKNDESNVDFVGHIGRFHFYWDDLKKNVVNAIRSFFIGLGIGILPGMGASLSNVVAYATAKNSSKYPEKFGEGCIDGVIAPEVANNAGIGGAIIPMIALGIPGDGTTALLLGAFLIHGVEAGPAMQFNQPEIPQMIYAAAIIGAITTLIVEILGIRLFPRILKVPYHLLYPAILVFASIGCYVEQFNIWGLIQFLIFTAIGIWFAIDGIPTTPFLLAYILGKTFESNFRNGMTYAKGDWTVFFTRPVSALFLAIGVFMVVKALVEMVRNNKKAAAKDFVE